MDVEAIYGASKRGNKTLIYRGFEFWYHKELKNGHVVWRCCKYRSCKCKAMVVARELAVMGNKEPLHTHEGNNNRNLARRAVGQMKQRLADTLATPAIVNASVASTLSEDVLMGLTKKATLTRATLASATTEGNW